VDIRLPQAVMAGSCLGLEREENGGEERNRKVVRTVRPRTLASVESFAIRVATAGEDMVVRNA